MMHAPGRHCCSTALTTLALAVALLLFASPRTVAAQLDELATTTCRGIAAPTEPISRAGRDEFVLGVTALEEERWADAERAFRRAYELNRSPVSLHNLGVALRALNRHRDARDAFCRVALDARVEQPEMREEAASFAREAANRLATVVVDHLAPEAATLTLDEAPVVIGQLPFTLELDADVRHVLALESEGFLRQALDVELAPGGVRHLSIDLERLPDGEGALVPLVVGIVVGVLVIGAGVGAWVGYEESQLRPTHPVLASPAL